jgi:hypothetical protein
MKERHFGLYVRRFTADAAALHATALMSRNIILACRDISARAVVCDDVFEVLMRCGH